VKDGTWLALGVVAAAGMLSALGGRGSASRRPLTLALAGAEADAFMAAIEMEDAGGPLADSTILRQAGEVLADLGPGDVPHLLHRLATRAEAGDDAARAIHAELLRRTGT
jgi:hypothetical protein